MKLFQGERYPFDCAGVYEIHVLGTANEGMSEYLAGMTFDRIQSSEDSDISETVLTGWLPDQAALNGVLNTLYDHSYTLTLVQRVEGGAAAAPA